MKTKYISTITVTDPDSKLPVEVEIRKVIETGALIGLDASFLELEVSVFSPYDWDVELEIPDDET